MHISDANKFIVLLITGLIIFFWTQNGSEIAFLLIVIAFLFHSKGRILTAGEKRYLNIFLAALLFAVILAIVHFELIFESSREYFISVFKIGIFCGFMLVVDAVAFQFNHFKIDASKFAKIVIYAVFISIVANFVWAYILNLDATFSELFFGTYRYSYLGLKLNANHADDLFVLQITILLFCNSILLIEDKKNYLVLSCSGLLITYFLYNIGVLGSRGGMVGLVVGFIFVACLLAARKAWKSCAVYVFILVVGVLVAPSASLNKLYSKFSLSQSVRVLEKELVVNRVVEKNKKTIQQNDTSKDALTKPEAKTVKPEENKAKVKLLSKKECYVKEYLGKHHKDIVLGFSTTVRLSLWADGFNVGSEKATFGHGHYDRYKLVENYDFAKPCKFVSVPHLHNFYLDLFIRGGYFAVLAFIGLSAALLWLLLSVLFSNNKYSLLAAPIVLHMSYLIVENIFDLTFFRTSELLNVLLCIAALCGITFALNEGEQTSIDEKASK